VFRLLQSRPWCWDLSSAPDDSSDPTAAGAKDYIVRFAEGTIISNNLFRYKRQRIMPQSPFSVKTSCSFSRPFFYIATQTAI
jgi:hypothetical protein